MNSKNQKGYYISFGNKKIHVSHERTIDDVVLFKQRAIKTINKYNEFDIVSCLDDVIQLISNMYHNTDRMFKDGFIFNLNNNSGKRKSIFTLNIKKQEKLILKWAYCIKLREIIDDVFDRNIVKNLYIKKFNKFYTNIIFKNDNMSEFIKNLKDFDIPYNCENVDIMTTKMVFYYERFVGCLYNTTLRYPIFDFYEIFEVVKNNYYLNKNNDNMLKILSSFKNGEEIIKISNFICNDDLFENFEEVDFNKIN